LITHRDLARHVNPFTIMKSATGLNMKTILRPSIFADLAPLAITALLFPRRARSRRHHGATVTAAQNQACADCHAKTSLPSSWNGGVRVTRKSKSAAWIVTARRRIASARETRRHVDHHPRHAPRIAAVS